ncbi:MAG: phosphoketolase, partial [Rhizobiaceae bacterium]|nr:phosphoketolase [Rhizobiaceae bacterium]
WDWACTCATDEEPDIVMACAGDVPTIETLAAVDLLRRALPQLKIRVVNVVDLMTLITHDTHPHGMTEEVFDGLFTTDKPVIFAYHGYPYLIHRLTYKRNNHVNFHVHGFQEEGTTTTPFDMAVMNRVDRYHLALAAIERIGTVAGDTSALVQSIEQKLADHKVYICEYGEDMPEIRNWRWQAVV